MINIDLKNAQIKFDNLMQKCIKYNAIVNIKTKNGNVILINENNYNNIIESLTLARIPGLYESIENGVNTSIDECAKINIK